MRTPKTPVATVSSGSSRVLLRPGEGARVPGGRLVFTGVSSWVGYSVFSNPALPWIFASAVMAALSLGVHFWKVRSGSDWRAGDGF